MVNAGARALKVWCGRRRGSAATLADALKVRPQAVHKWARAQAMPTPDKRDVLERLTGIPADAWERR